MSEHSCYVTRKHIVHRAADCCDCEWYEDGKNITQKAKRHVEKTGHEVAYEIMSSCRYKAL